MVTRAHSRLNGATSIVITLALSASLALSACGSGSSGGEKWQTHKDKRGFEIRHPAGWKVKSKDNLLITVSDRAGKEFVAIAPFIAPAQTSAEQCLDQAPDAFPSVFEGARPSGVRSGSQTGEALASVRLERSGTPIKAAMLCATDGRAGTLYVIAAPAKQFDGERSQLVRVLNSLRFSKPAGSKSDDGGSAQLSYTKFTDPNEDAFTVDVPEGWSVDGGLERRSSVEAWPNLKIESPDGNVRVFAGQDDMRSYALPNPTLDSTGFPEGSEYSPGYGVTFIVRRYASGAEYAADHAEGGLGCDAFEQTGGGERPDLSKKLSGIYEQNGVVAQRIEIGDVAFHCSGPLDVGYVLAGTLLTEFQGIGNWSVQYLYGYLANSDSEELARTVMEKMVSSFAINPKWAASQQQPTGDVSQIVADTNAEISKTITGGYEQRQQVLDDVYRNWSNYTLGQTDVRDPTTGEEFKVASGHNYYWRQSGSNEITGEDTGEPPDVDFQLLKEF